MVDALCIDQQDINERNYQVTQMGRIYALAKMVLVWLGKYGDGSTSLAIDAILQEAELLPPVSCHS
jgi:hypothetical protein